MWQQLELANELQSYLQGTVGWIGISMLEKLFFFFDWSNNTGAIDMKMDESALEEKSSFKMLGLTFASKLD